MQVIHCYHCYVWKYGLENFCNKIVYFMNKVDFFFNKFSLSLLLLLIFFFNFHAIISKYLFFYKELFSLMFTILTIIYIFNFKLKIVDLIFKNKIYIFFFPYLFLILIFCFNTGQIDPEFSKSSIILNNDTGKNFLLLYTIRNFIILMPVVLFFSLRGISENELKKILLFIVIVGSIGLLGQIIYQKYSIEVSLYHYLYNYNFFAFNNTYIPFISSIYIVGTYLILKEKNSLIIFTILTIFISFLLFIIILSSAKSPILFCLCSLIFLLTAFFKKKKIIVLFFVGKIVIISILIASLNQLHYSYKASLQSIYENLQKKELKKNEKILLLKTKDLMKYYNMDKDSFTLPLFNSKFNRTDLTSRKDVYNSFFNYIKKITLSDHKFYFGSGSLSSTFSGYHNDYMRIFYRAGFFGLLFAFIPFFYFFFKFLIFTFKKYFFNKNDMQTDFDYLLTILLGFNLYYSLFAYPREDVYQSSTIWFTLILMYGYLNKKITKK